MPLDAHTEETDLVQACLKARPFAWQRFVDHYLPLVLQTVHEVDVQASRGWSEKQHEQLTQDVFQHLRKDNYQLLRQWDGKSDFSTWLIIAIRRITCGSQQTSD